MIPNDLLIPLVRASIEGALLIGAVWCLTRLMPRMLPSARCTLWWLASFRLLLGCFSLLTIPVKPPLPPIEPPAAISSMSYLPRIVGPALVVPVRTARAPVATKVAEDEDVPATPPVPAPATEPVRFAATFDLMAWAPAFLLILWAVGVIVTIFLQLRDARRLQRLWRAATRVDSPTVRNWLGAWIEDPHAGRVELRASPDVGSPLVMGWYSPRILLPSHCLDFDPARLRMALAHEVSHIRRMDLWWGGIPALAECLFWFHPLARWCAREYALAREESCDAEALRLSQSTIDRYGELLLGFGVDGARSMCGAYACGSPHARHLKRRIQMLTHALVTTRRQRVIAVAVMVLIGAVAIAPIRFVAAARESAPSKGTDGGYTELVTTQTPSDIACEDEKKSSKTMVTAISTDEDDEDDDAEKRSYSYSISDDEHEGRFSYGITTGENTSMSGSLDNYDMRALERLRKLGGEGTLAWFRINRTTYIVRDEDLIKDIQEVMQPQMDLGKEQGRLGAQQGRLGAQQGKLGAMQGELGSQQGVLSSRLAQVSMEESQAKDGSRKREYLRALREELEARIEELSAKMEELGSQQNMLGESQNELGEIQNELGARQEEVSRVGRERMRKLAKQLLEEGGATKLEE